MDNNESMLQNLIDKNESVGDESTQSNNQTTILDDSMKLPPMTPPLFDGDLQNWTSFINIFNAMFHNNSCLSDVQRLYYLKSCLTNSAAEIIKSILMTEENYHVVYDTIVERYENKSLIIQSHIHALLQTPQVLQPSASELRKLYNHIVSQYRVLKALNQPVEYWDAWLVTLISCKLDPITVSEWQLSQETKNLPKFEDIEKFLANRISLYEVSEKINALNSSMENQTNTSKQSIEKIIFTTNQSISKVSNVKTEEDNAQPKKATFRYEINNFSKLEGTRLSPPCYINNFSWKILIMRNNNKNKRSTLTAQPSVGFFLQCNSDSKNYLWTIYACAELRIISQNIGVQNVKRKIQHMFRQIKNDWGYSYYISWKDIIDESKGLIKNDNVIFEVSVTTYTT